MSRSRSSSTTPIRSVLAGLVERLQGGGRPSQEEMVTLWRQLAGEEAARHSWPKRLAQQRLIVEVENSGWMYALGMRKAQLLEGLVELMGAGRVRQLSFRIGEGKDG